MPLPAYPASAIARVRGGHEAIQAQRALAAAEHEKPQGACPAGISLGRRRQGSDRRPHRIADGDGPAGSGETARESLEHDPGKTRQQAVGQSGHGILLMNRKRPAGEPGGDAAGTADEAAHAEHSGGPPAKNDGQRLRQRPDESERRRQDRRETFATQAADGYPFDIDAVLRHHARFEAPARAEPEHRLLSGLERLGDGQRRVHVAASAARHDHNRPRAHDRRLRAGLPADRERFTGVASTLSS